MKSKPIKKTESSSGREELRQRLAGMSPMEKVEYIATYYWGRILLAVFLVIALIWGAQWLGKLQDHSIFYVALMDASYSSQEAEAFCQGFVDSLEDAGPHDVMRLDTSLVYLEPNQADTRLYDSYLSKELMMEEAGLDVYLTPVEFYEENRERDGMFLPLEEVLGEEYSRYEDDILDGTALVLEECRLTREGGTKYTPVYLTVPSGAEHPEYVLDFIHYLYTD